jgi:hypothetical protein
MQGVCTLAKIISWGFKVPRKAERGYLADKQMDRCREKRVGKKRVYKMENGL